jgi:hypothetical protein
MRNRKILPKFGLLLCAITGLVLLAPASATAGPTPSDIERLQAAGINVSQLNAGWSVVGDQIWWDGGNIKRSIAPTAFICDSGYVCLYEDGDVLGSLLEIRLPINTYLYMPNYGFNDRMSSWINKRGLDARWYYTSGTPNPNRCMFYPGSDEHLPLADNDQMSTLYIYNSTTVC